MKIAPELDWFVHAYGDPDGEIEEKARRQFAALKAVARAAGPFLTHAINADEPCFGECKEGRRLRQALARLDKVSTGRAGKGESKP